MGATVDAMMKSTPVLFIALVVASCATTVGTGDRATIPEDAASTCASQCESVGLELDGLALGDGYVNCICEPSED